MIKVTFYKQNEEIEIQEFDIIYYNKEIQMASFFAGNVCLLDMPLKLIKKVEKQVKSLSLLEMIELNITVDKLGNIYLNGDTQLNLDDFIDITRRIKCK